jgi:hypothetical protein
MYQQGNGERACCTNALRKQKKRGQNTLQQSIARSPATHALEISRALAGSLLML